MKEFLARLTPPCREVIRLSSESMDRTLPFTKQAIMRLHLMMCKGCRRYAEQLHAIRRQLRSQVRASSDSQLSDEQKSRLKRALKAHEP